jgi:hypothetical protein
VLGNGEGVRRAISEPEITPCSTNTVSSGEQNGVFNWQDSESSPFIESHKFAEQIARLNAEEAVRELENELMQNPDNGT